MAKKMLVSFVLDETGSMQSCKEQTISGFNEYISTLRAEKNAGDIRFTMVKFNSSKTELVCEAAKLGDVSELNQENYQPSATTPLYDAIGAAIRSAERVVDGKKRSVLIAIQTDGYENASGEYDQRGIFDLIEAKKRDGWQFAFLGADQDAYAASAQIGIAVSATLSYDSANTTGAFKRFAESTTSHTRSGSDFTFEKSK